MRCQWISALGQRFSVKMWGCDSLLKEHLYAAFSQDKWDKKWLARSQLCKILSRTLQKDPPWMISHTLTKRSNRVPHAKAVSDDPTDQNRKAVMSLQKQRFQAARAMVAGCEGRVAQRHGMVSGRKDGDQSDDSLFNIQVVLELLLLLLFLREWSQHGRPESLGTKSNQHVSA